MESNSSTSEDKYIQRVKIFAKELSALTHGWDAAAYYMCNFIEMAKYCVIKQGEEFGNGIIIGQNIDANNILKLPSEYLLEHGFLPEM